MPPEHQIIPSTADRIVELERQLKDLSEKKDSPIPPGRSTGELRYSHARRSYPSEISSVAEILHGTLETLPLPPRSRAQNVIPPT